MSDFYKEMLQKSIERQAKDIVNTGATESDRYGNLLDGVNGRDLEQEEKDRLNSRVVDLQQDNERIRAEREAETKETSATMRRIRNDAIRREANEEKAFVTKYKDAIEKGKESLRKQDKSYFG